MDELMSDEEFENRLQHIYKIHDGDFINMRKAAVALIEHEFVMKGAISQSMYEVLEAIPEFLSSAHEYHERERAQEVIAKAKTLLRQVEQSQGKKRKPLSFISGIIRYFKNENEK